MWISLCISRYKAGFCWGLQRTVSLSQISPCHPSRTPYNAQPLRRHNGLQASGSGGSGSI
ncbi:hypothetical protein CI789_17245 [Erwinia persicina]|uniref:Uncharacterized protein n=1 Tax=Erwinia persicina TaxID=55211 RepID=A0A3S7SB22_9GAMM|nr:hypothetical protein CI789_17245 [Erwinia persicina]TKJ83723.1 hypothetical protein EpCFBP13511_22110 [Erwinia persicina]